MQEIYGKFFCSLLAHKDGEKPEDAGKMPALQGSEEKSRSLAALGMTPGGGVPRARDFL